MRYILIENNIIVYLSQSRVWRTKFQRFQPIQFVSIVFKTNCVSYFVMMCFTGYAVLCLKNLFISKQLQPTSTISRIFCFNQVSLAEKTTTTFWCSVRKPSVCQLSVCLFQSESHQYRVRFRSFSLSGCIFCSSRNVGCLVRLKNLVWTELPGHPCRKPTLSAA